MTQPPNLNEVYGSLEQAYDLPPGILKAVEYAGTGHLPARQRDTAVGPRGTLGRFQFLDSTAKSVGVNDATDPVQAAQGAARLLSLMADSLGTDNPTALGAAYAGGLDVAMGNRAMAPSTRRWLDRFTSAIQSAGAQPPARSIADELSARMTGRQEKIQSPAPLPDALSAGQPPTGVEASPSAPTPSLTPSPPGPSPRPALSPTLVPPPGRAGPIGSIINQADAQPSLPFIAGFRDSAITTAQSYRQAAEHAIDAPVGLAAITATPIGNALRPSIALYKAMAPTHAADYDRQVAQDRVNRPPAGGSLGYAVGALAGDVLLNPVNYLPAPGGLLKNVGLAALAGGVGAGQQPSPGEPGDFWGNKTAEELKGAMMGAGTGALLGTAGRLLSAGAGLPGKVGARLEDIAWPIPGVNDVLDALRKAGKWRDAVSFISALGTGHWAQAAWIAIRTTGAAPIGLTKWLGQRADRVGRATGGLAGSISAMGD